MGNIKEDLLQSKFLLDSTIKAIKIATDNEVDKSIVEKLIISKKQLANSYRSQLESIDDCFTGRNNVCKLGSDWYAVKYVNSSGNDKADLFLLNSDDLYMLDLDTVRPRHFQEQELKAIIPAIEDEVLMSIYNSKVDSQSYMMLSDLGISLESDIEMSSIRPSAHSCKRWVQRKLGIQNENQAEEYRRQHFNTIQDEVIEGYKNSELLWTDDEGIEYWFDEHNVVYVVGNNIIITIYEEDFGFKKDLNRTIVFSQLETIKESWENLKKLEEEQYKIIGDIERQVSQYDQQISTLEAKILEIKSKKGILTSKRDMLHHGYKTQHQKFNEEFNKLFRRYKNN